MKIVSLLKCIIVVILFVLLVVILYLFFSRFSIVNFALTRYANENFHWQCQRIKQKSLTKTGSVKWERFNCHATFPKRYFLRAPKPTGILTINLIDANLADQQIYLTPVLAQNNKPKSPYVETLLKMGRSNPKFIAGINGGYFFVNRRGRRDLNCIGKHYPELTTQGVGDGLLVINNKQYSANCGFGPIAALGRSSLLQSYRFGWRIKRVVANQYPKHVLNALGAGPGLIQTIKGKPEIKLYWEGISSTFEFSANTAVALAKDHNHRMHVIFFTINGIDRKQGMGSAEMANFIYYIVPTWLRAKLISAMSMDQGHSTTMYVRSARPQIVSKAALHRHPRAIYNALFISEK